MDIGIGLDATLGLSYERQMEVSAEAARLGYTSIWTPETGGDDPFLLCSLRWRATTNVVTGGVTTGIGVSPVAVHTPMSYAMSGATLSKMSGGRFILGLGTGGAYTREYRRAWGLRGRSTLALMSDYLRTVRSLLRGETVMHEGQTIVLRGAKLNAPVPPPTPVYLGALGPEMCRLGGELADGLCLNWCNPEQIAWSRKRLNEGAARAGRDPSEIKLAEYIRVCVDGDADTARRAFTRAVMGYALGPLGREPQGYRAHFERMGFAADLARIDVLRQRNAPQEEISDAFPEALLKAVGYYGPAAGAAAAFRRLSEGLDTAIVRVVAAGPGLDSVLAVMKACQPAQVPA